MAAHASLDLSEGHEFTRAEKSGIESLLSAEGPARAAAVFAAQRTNTSVFAFRRH